MLKYHYIGLLHGDSSYVAVVASVEMLVIIHVIYFLKTTELMIYNSLLPEQFAHPEMSLLRIEQVVERPKQNSKNYVTACVVLLMPFVTLSINQI